MPGTFSVGPLTDSYTFRLTCSGGPYESVDNVNVYVVNAISSGHLPILDVDGNNIVEAATDMVYISRRLSGLSAVPPSFRESDPTIPSDAIVNSQIDGIKSFLDVDHNGRTEVSTDMTYITRYIQGINPVPPSFRTSDPTIPSDAVISAAIEQLLRS